MIPYESWLEALNSYSYPVDLRDYEHKDRFLNHFKWKIAGDRKTTIAFEDYFRKNARSSIEVYCEIVFWKLYSRRRDRQQKTKRIVDHLLEENVKPELLYHCIWRFANKPTLEHLTDLRWFLGIKTDVLAVALTFPAFMYPLKYPMVDSNVARWVNANFTRQNKKMKNKLTPFVGFSSLRDNDFENYLNWVAWCNEMASILSEKSHLKWRPRDVEMAVFTAQRNSMKLYPLI